MKDILLKYFPDAQLIVGGLDNGKYETAEWLFHLECGFFIRKADRKTFFVDRLNGELAWEGKLIILNIPMVKG